MTTSDAILLMYATLWVVVIVWMAVASYRSLKKNGLRLAVNNRRS